MSEGIEELDVRRQALATPQEPLSEETFTQALQVATDASFDCGAWGTDEQKECIPYEECFAHFKRANAEVMACYKSLAARLAESEKAAYDVNRTIDHLKQQLADVTKKRDELRGQFVKLDQEHLKLRHTNTHLQTVIAGQRRVLASRNHSWVENKLRFMKTIEYLRAKLAGERPQFGRGSDMHLVDDLQSRLVEVKQQLANMTKERDALLENGAYLAARTCEAPYHDDYGNSRCQTIDQLHMKLADAQATEEPPEQDETEPEGGDRR